MLSNRLFYESTQDKKEKLKKGLSGAALVGGAAAGGAYLGNKLMSKLKYSKFGKSNNPNIPNPGEFSTEVPPDTRRRIEQEALRRIQGEY